MKKYKNLFTPFTVKQMTVRNRIVMTPMGTNYGGENGEFTDEHMEYYEQRAKGGTGLIIVENACIDYPLGSNGTTQIRINHDRFIPALFSHTEEKVTKQTNVVVIGGGTAGLEAACTAAEVGCTTFLIESRPKLGGLAKQIAKLPEKNRINDFPDYLIQRAEKLKNLIVFTNTKADAKIVANLKPDLIVNATGSTPLLPPIKGLLDNVDKGGKVHSIFSLMNDIESFDFKDNKVVVIGGGAVGLDVVELFSSRGAKVSIVERLPMLARDLDIVTQSRNVSNGR